MVRLFSYWFLLLLALAPGWMPLEASAASAIGDFEVVKPETSAGTVTLPKTISNNKPIARFRRPLPPVPAYTCNFVACVCYDEDDCIKMFEEVDCGPSVFDADTNTGMCLWPVERDNPKGR